MGLGVDSTLDFEPLGGAPAAPSAGAKLWVASDGGLHLRQVGGDKTVATTSITFGTIKLDGTIRVAGSGDWSVVRVGPGAYTVTWTAKAAPPAVTATVIESGASGAYCRMTSFPSTTATTFQVINLSGAAEDNDVSFMAIS